MATPAYAQLESNMSITFEPRLIELGKKVTAELRSPAVDTSTALIIWKLNDVIIAQGIGLHEASFTLTSRATANLEVMVIEQDGVETKIVYPIQPSDVDIIWEGVSYVPPLYDGRPRVAAGGRVRVAAIPHTTLGTPDTLVYTWSQDGIRLNKQSGFAKNTTTISMPPFGDSTFVSVTVKTLTGEVIGGNSVRITPSPVAVRVYQQRPLVGLWLNNTVAIQNISNGMVTVRAIPFFMDGTSLSKIKYTWTSTTGAVQQESPGVATYEVGNGKNVVSVTASHPAKLLQSATEKTEIGTQIEKTMFGI
jgi:hypothetical protein